MISQQVNEVVEMIADKLGVAVELVYPSLKEQAMVFCDIYSVVLWIVGISCIILFASVIGTAITADKYTNAATVGLGASIAGIILTGLILIIGGIWLIGSLKSYLTALNNPEWWSVEYVLKMISGL